MMHGMSHSTHSRVAEDGTSHIVMSLSHIASVRNIIMCDVPKCIFSIVCKFDHIGRRQRSWLPWSSSLPTFDRCFWRCCCQQFQRHFPDGHFAAPWQNLKESRYHQEPNFHSTESSLSHLYISKYSLQFYHATNEAKFFASLPPQHCH